MKKVVIALMMAALFVNVGNVSEAAEVDHRSWTVVHVSYEAQEGIRELNDWLLTRDVKKSDVLRINYWERVNK